MDSFTSYAAYTNLDLLEEFSAKPLRKSLRVNTIKSSVEAIEKWGEDHGWDLTPVPWCNEAFFIDREDRSTALGKDLLHLLGHFYMQESASMLPVELLDPQPGDIVLDLSSAPGSKTSQIAAKIGKEGTVVANDIQEKRLFTLKSALHRLGVHNAIVTKRTGQWFGPHMAERFHRVLIDAPCTAQGTVRKDPDALKYCSQESIEHCARLQYQLLESAVHCCKVGGRIVYSTCTLTKEENEDVCIQILNNFADQLQVVDPVGLGVGNRGWDCRTAIEDSVRVQEHSKHPFLRLWPQTYNTEGFFCAVFEKTAPTCDRRRLERVFFQEKPMLRHRMKEVTNPLMEQYGTDFLLEGDLLFEREKEVVLSTENISKFFLPLQNYALGIPFGKRIKQNQVRLHHDLVLLRGHMATKNVVQLNNSELDEVLNGKDIQCSTDLEGDVILLWNNISIGIGLAQKGVLKNRLSRWMVSLHT